MKNLNKQFIYSAALISSMSLLMVVGCAGTESTKSNIDTSLTEKTVDAPLQEVVDDQLVPVEETIVKVVEIDEPVVEVQEVVESEEPEIKQEAVSKVTPQPEEYIISFAFDDVTVSENYGELLWQYAQYLKEHDGLTLNVTGHTDASGERLYNEMLSKKRAEEVAKILVDFGVSADRIRTTGLADDMPLANAASHRQHRRVEIDFSDDQIVSN